MPRLFTGIELPIEIRTRLSLLSAPLTGAKWVEADNLHLTLRFLGDIDHRTADEFIDSILPFTVEPFEMSITGLGVFGSQRPDVIWAGAEPKDVLGRLNQWHERAARAAGLEADSRPFVPHVTLARLRGTKPHEVARFLEGRGGLQIPPFRVSRLAIFSARPGTGGGPYAVEETIAFEEDEADADADPASS
jgi:RNA 2',3'-cyclic 3'-phosphodiesterase